MAHQKNGHSSRKDLEIRSIKKRISESEYIKEREKIESAAKSIEDIKDILASVLVLKNGLLSTGDIKYAAFRVETLSLIFELMRDAFKSKAKRGLNDYREYLENLGDEVGFTFARELISNLVAHNELLNVKTRERLLILWSLYENDTGAGVTTIQKVTQKKIVIKLRNNPLRYVESEPHSHCHFYVSYLKTLINILLTARARMLQEQLGDISAEAPKVVSITEEPDADDNCVFEVQLRPEKLTKAFDLLEQALVSFEKGDYYASSNSVRAAIKSAQLEKLFLDESNAPKNVYKAFKEVLDSKHYNLMDHAYHRVSKILHPERDKTPKNLNKWAVFGILRDIRRVIYILEVTDISPEKAHELVAKARHEEILKQMEDAVKNSKQLDSSMQINIQKEILKLKKAELDKKNVENFTERLRQIGGKSLEVLQPIISDLIAALIKKETGLM